MLHIGVEHNGINGWELTYAYNDGPACMAPEEEAIVYPTKEQAVEQAKRESAEYQKELKG